MRILAESVNCRPGERVKVQSRKTGTEFRGECVGHELFTPSFDNFAVRSSRSSRSLTRRVDNIIFLFLRMLLRCDRWGRGEGGEYRVPRSFTPHLPLNAAIQFSRLFAWHEHDRVQCYLKNHGRGLTLNTGYEHEHSTPANVRLRVSFPKNFGENANRSVSGREKIRSLVWRTWRCVPKRNRYS